ncbi:hypothetical protein PMAYCL1PPCAC_26743, partial [Pristionchus mayeri]
MSSLVELPFPKKRANGAEFTKAFDEYKAVVGPFLEYATFKRAFPLIFTVYASLATAQELKERTQEIRRRINLYLSKDTLDVGLYPKSKYLKSDENLNEISCLHWNCCGIVGQIVHTKDTSLLDLIVALEPDIILLNEIKAKDDDIKAVVMGLHGYSYLSTPSHAPKGRSMRGSAIIYRHAYKFKVIWAGQETWSENAEGGEIEAIAVDIQTSAGKRFRIITSYVRGADQHFEEAEKIFKKLASNSSPTIITGDLNMRKEKFVKKWAESGFVDSLNPAWYTNKTKNTLTSIDYVMHNGKPSPLVCHRPIQPDNNSVHFPIPFSVRFPL